MLHAQDLALLEAIDWHPNVRPAMLDTAAQNPETAAAAERARAAAARTSQEADHRRAEMLAAQEMIWYRRATQRPSLREDDPLGTPGLPDQPARRAAPAPVPSPQTVPKPRRRAPLLRAATASQPCLLGTPPLALPPLRFSSEASVIGTSDRLVPTRMLARARSLQQLEVQKQQAPNASSSSTGASRSSTTRPVTAAAARRLHARVGMYMPLR